LHTVSHVGHLPVVFALIPRLRLNPCELPFEESDHALLSVCSQFCDLRTRACWDL